jgi:prepilin-type N-terminal cleavage/methylation domain-containing protein
MKSPVVIVRNSSPELRHRRKGFTLIELMIVLVIVAIGVVLALPTWRTFIEKRELTSAVERFASFVEFARSEAVKRNEEVRVAWKSSHGHSGNFCIGLSAAPKSRPCDCTVTTATANNFCSIGASAAGAADGIGYRLSKTDFVDIGNEFMHMNPTTANFGFDPVRGIVVNASSNEILDNDSLFYAHSNEGSGDSRLFALQMHLNVTGKFNICYEADRLMRIGGYPKC